MAERSEVGPQYFAVWEFEGLLEALEHGERQDFLPNSVSHRLPPADTSRGSAAAGGGTMKPKLWIPAPPRGLLALLWIFA
jgi:hypothetical protein